MQYQQSSGTDGSWFRSTSMPALAVAFVMNRWIGGFDLGRCIDIVNAAYDRW